MFSVDRITSTTNTNTSNSTRASAINRTMRFGNSARAISSIIINTSTIVDGGNLAPLYEIASSDSIV
jgi:hypothetical protein